MKMYLGTDVHCKHTVYTAQDNGGKVLQESKVPTSRAGLAEMKQRLKAPKGTPVALESGGQAFYVARLLQELGLQPVVVDAQEVRAKARSRRQKSDQRDAFELCDGLRRGVFTKIVYVPPPEISRLRELLSRRRHFVRLRTAEVNAAKYLLRARGLGELVKSLVSAAAWERLLAQPAVQELRMLLNCHYQVWRAAQQQEEQLNAELQEALQPFAAEHELLRSAPGVGPLTAATFIAVLATPERFADSGKVVSYAGLAPSTYDSGEAVRHGRITKQGSPELRSMLCEAAHQAARPTHPLHPYFRRLCAKSGYKKAIVAVAQRLARILYQMWKKHERFDARHLNVLHQPTERKRLVYWLRKDEAAARRAPAAS